MSQFPSQWPGISSELTGVAGACLRGQIDPASNLGTWRIRRKQFYHRLAYAAAGATSFSFFNVNPSTGVSNWPSPNGLNNESVFIMTALSFRVDANTTVAGAAQAANNPAVYSATPATAGEPFDIAAELDAIYRNGLVTLRIGDFNLIDGEYGLSRFPQGGGSCGAFAFGGVDSDLAAGAFGGAGVVTNGVPAANNVYRFTPQYPILPQKPVLLTLQFLAALSLGAQPGTILAEMDGLYISPSNQ